ncbi:MAG: CBS domain-containing protein [Nitriliruptorales bacterium]|nr:CBS domain-containing protein [Nitriliruptorales bacterium]
MPKLSEVIEHDPVTVEPHEPLSRAAQRMYDHRIGSVVVVDDDGALVGIFTERDLMRASAAGVDTHRATVGRWMTGDPVVANATDEAAAALQVMIDNGFRHLPVIGEGGLIGVVSMRSLSTVLQKARMG